MELSIEYLQVKKIYQIKFNTHKTIKIMPIGTPSVPYRLPGSQYERWVDIYTRLGVERILFLGQEVNDGIANSLVAQMLYLDSDDNSKPIYLYINSPGGSVTAGLAIYDTITVSYTHLTLPTILLV